MAAPLPEQPKAPAPVCPGQKMPAAPVSLAVPVVIGVRLTGNEGSAAAGGGSQS